MHTHQNDKRWLHIFFVEKFSILHLRFVLLIVEWLMLLQLLIYHRQNNLVLSFVLFHQARKSRVDTQVRLKFHWHFQHSNWIPEIKK